jgi:hypothetical protein
MDAKTLVPIGWRLHISPRLTRFRFVTRPTRRSRTRLAQISRVALALISVAGLVGLHVRLLWLRVVEGTLWSPAIAGRWAAALLLCAAIALLRRAGIPLFWGRKALVLWLLVLVLHAAAAAAPLEVDLAWAIPAAATTVLCTLLFLLGPALPLGARLVERCRRLDPRAAVQRLRVWLPLVVPRPPPLALVR